MNQDEGRDGERSISQDPSNEIEGHGVTGGHILPIHCHGWTTRQEVSVTPTDVTTILLHTVCRP